MGIADKVPSFPLYVKVWNSAFEKVTGTVSVVFGSVTMMLSATTTNVAIVDPDENPVEAVRVVGNDPEAVGVPEMIPAGLIVSPAGSPTPAYDPIVRPDNVDAET
jgi:hypothetical protein